MSSFPMPKSMMAPARGPTVFFAHVPAMSCTNGVYCFTLGAGSPIPLQDGKLMNELVGVGQIHGTRSALMELRVAIDRILSIKLPDADDEFDTQDRGSHGRGVEPKH